MPTLQELKSKWFIDDSTVLIEADPTAGAPLNRDWTVADLGMNFRHVDANLSNHTDGNSVTMLLEGEDYLSIWYDVITRPTISVIYSTNWRIDNVQTKSGVPASTALDVLIQVNNSTADVYQIVDGNKLAANTNMNSQGYLRLWGVTSIRDFRFPINGSVHQKFTIAKEANIGWALIGSIDVTVNRLDDSSHSGNYSKITHDFGALVEGPAVADIENTFLDRWNDASRSRRWPYKAVSPDGTATITNAVGTYPPTGGHSIQLLRTYGVGAYSYSWADEQGEGEFSIWASTINAIRSAEQYIYIEDQTFLTFAWPPCCDQHPNMLARKTDLIYQLGEALKRGVRVGILVADSGGFSGSSPFETYQRHYSLNYLSNIASNHGNNIFVGSLKNTNSTEIYVHSKLFIADDEFALIGSANFDQRSMTHDGEIKIGVVDQDNIFVKQLRSTLFEEHSLQSDTTDADPIVAFDNMKTHVVSQHGRLQNYNFSFQFKPRGHQTATNTVWWPYAGPVGLR